MWRKMLKISWMQEVTNHEVLTQFKRKGTLSTISTSENTSALSMCYDMMDYCTQIKERT